MKLISFSFYYTKFLLGVMLGVHRTVNPLNIKWRWNFWQHKIRKRRKSLTYQKSSVMKVSNHRVNSNTNSLTILQRIALTDENAVIECVETYGNLVWSMAKKYTDSPKAAETFAQSIFLDIWKYAGRFDPGRIDEITFISHLAHRRLTK